MQTSPQSESANRTPGLSSMRLWWHGSRGDGRGDARVRGVRDALAVLREPVCLLGDAPAYHVAEGGSLLLAESRPSPDAIPVAGYAPPMSASDLGDPSFMADFAVEYPYMTGAMANAIASTDLVEAVAMGGMLGSYGAAGRSIAEIEAAIERLDERLGRRSHCFNLIHSPSEPLHEAAVVELYLRRQVRQVEASAYLDLTLPVVRYRLAGIRSTPDGGVIAPNRIIAKASRVEVASRWWNPPPAELVAELVSRRELSEAQANMARKIPAAQDLTAEADSGGHTDNRPAITLIPTMIALRNRIQAECAYPLALRVGAAGGIATPLSAAAAFAMGAAYVVTGSINQGCVESGSSDSVRGLLAQAEQADVAMAPAADMFEMGVRLQVLKRGTLFAMRAAKLYDLYRGYDDLGAIPAKERSQLERTVFRAPLEQIWGETYRFFSERDPTQVARANTSGKVKMALVFRWYLGQSSEWANAGAQARQADYQVWCGPAMGAFNEWVKGSHLEHLENRRVAEIGLNLIHGAATAARLNGLKNQGIRLGAASESIRPRTRQELEGFLA